MTGQEWLKAMYEQHDFDPEDAALVHAIATTMDRAAATTSARDQRADQRLLNEMLRTLYQRLEGAAESPSDRSAAGRRLARQRWSTR